MPVYELCFNHEKYKTLMPVDDDFWLSSAELFNGRRILSTSWQCIQLESVPSIRELLLGDFTDFSVFYIPVMSQEAKDAVESTINQCAEFLMAKFESKNFFLLNVHKLIDVLDLNKSKVKRLASSGKIIEIEKAVFLNKDTLPPIFKLTNMPLGKVYVTDEFKHMVELSILSGFEFKPL